MGSMFKTAPVIALKGFMKVEKPSSIWFRRGLRVAYWFHAMQLMLSQLDEGRFLNEFPSQIFYFVSTPHVSYPKVEGS